MPLPESVPLVSVKKKETVASESFGLARAKPVFIDGVNSTLKRPADRGAEAGIPASEIKTPFCR